jgi:SSS family solute:Na+ symporter
VADVNLTLTLLLLYTVSITAFGVWMGRRVKGAADFFVAGRGLTWPLVGGTVLAANIGAGTTVGAAGLAYRDGISAWWWNGAVGIGTLVLAMWVGPRLWAIASRKHHLTAGDFLEDRYNATVRGVVATLLTRSRRRRPGPPWTKRSTTRRKTTDAPSTRSAADGIAT